MELEPSQYNPISNLEQELVTVEYKPILGVEMLHTKKVKASAETIVGMAVVASQLIDLDRFAIRKSNSTLIDIPACLELPYVVHAGQPVTLPYTAKFLGTKVQFISQDFIAGAILVCQLLGIGWNSIITNIIGLVVTPNFYLGEVEVEQFVDESSVHIRYLQYFLTEASIDSAIQRLDECFHVQDNLAIYLPAKLTFSSADPEFTTITALSMATPYLDHLPIDYRHYPAWYLFNVCAGNKYRGQGYTKSVLIAQINGLIATGITDFFLEVDPDNTPAWKLYQSLGFYKIDSVENGKYDLYYLPINK